MKTTIEISDDLFRRTKSTAAMRGQSLKDFVTEALQERLERTETTSPRVRGWRSVFGRARPEEVEPIDEILAADLERIDPRDWQ